MRKYGFKDSFDLPLSSKHELLLFYIGMEVKEQIFGDHATQVSDLNQ